VKLSLSTYAAFTFLGAKRTKWDNAGQQAAIPPVGSLIKKK